MKNQNIGRTNFRYTLNHLDFECLFFIDIKPFELVMGCLHQNFAIFLDVEQGFSIKPFIKPKSTFIKLVKALNTLDDSDHKFVPHEFFDEFNQHIPNRANPHTPVTPSDIIKYYSNIEEEDKIHFCGWLDNNIQNNKVSEKNLIKTRRFMGQQVYEFAKRRNQSTRWTPDPSQAVELFLPE